MADHRRVDELAARQHGLITLAQLVESGVARSTVVDWTSSGRLQRLHPETFRLAGTPRSWLQAVHAAQLAGGPESLVSNGPAAALHHLDGVVGRGIELLTVRHHRRVLRGVRVHETLELRAADRWLIDGIAVTAIDRTLIDVGRAWRAERVGRLLDDAVRRRLTTYERFADRVESLARRGRPGIGTARQVLAERDLGSAYVGFGFEDRVFRLLQGAGLPRPDRQLPIRHGELRYYVDLGYPEAALGIECDSTMFHTLPHQVRHDLRRQNHIQQQEVLLLRYTNHDLRTRPDEVAAEVRSAYRKRLGRWSWPAFGAGELPPAQNMR